MICTLKTGLFRREKMKLIRVNSSTAGRNCSIQFYNEKTGQYSARISAGTKDRAEAERIAYRWLKEGIPGKGSVQKNADVEALCLAIGREDFSKLDAEKILLALKARGFLSEQVKISDKKSPFFLDYLYAFWDYKKSPYVRKKNLAGRGIKKSTCIETLGKIKKHTRGYFDGVRLSEIERKALESFLLDLREKGISAATANTVQKAMRTALKFAYHEGLIPYNPADGLISFNAPPKPRGILTHEEVAALFKASWGYNLMIRAANLLASQTGLRLGEVLGLKKKDIKKNYIIVEYSYNSIDGLSTTKTKKERIVPINAQMKRELLEFANAPENPERSGEAFVFFSRLPWRPLDRGLVTRGLYSALKEIGISEVERKERNIVFHSWRHYVATYLSRNTDIRTAKRVTGHSTDDMFNLYAEHEDSEDFKKMQAVLNDMTQALI